MNNALGLPKKSEVLWDILTIADINTKVEENMADIDERFDQLEECCDCTKRRKFILLLL